MRKTIGSQSSPSRSVCSRKWNSFVLKAASCALSLWLYNLKTAVWNLLNSFLHKSVSYPRGNLGVYCICVFNLLYYLAKEMYVQMSTVVHVLFFELYRFWRISYMQHKPSLLFFLLEIFALVLYSIWIEIVLHTWIAMPFSLKSVVV